jgi:hypothetical protein
MKRIMLAVLLCICIFLPLGCNQTLPSATAKLGQEFQLNIGQSATLSDAELKVKFDDVIEDSRCPGDVVCIWAGRVSCMMEITIDNAINKTVLTQSGLTGDYTTEQFQQYQLQFRVEPYPRTDTEIKDSDYRLLLTITKAP